MNSQSRFDLLALLFHFRDSRAISTMFAVPSVPVEKNQVRCRIANREIIDSEKLQDRGALSASLLRVELPNSHQLSGRHRLLV
jgi:hypothetical protein